MPPPLDASPTWTVIMPVKVLSEAKTRIDPDRGGAGGLLARAFFLDTVEAVRACPRVGRIIVVTADPIIAADAAGLGLDVVSDEGHAGINEAARWAATFAAAHDHQAVVVSDLPSLTPDALDTVLSEAEAGGTAFLADAEGTGTTMWMGGAGEAVDPHFGPGSALAHRSAGCHDLAASAAAARAAAARRDVDTESDLADALSIGVGAHTRAALSGAAPSAASSVVLTVLGRADDAVELADENGGRHRLPWSTLAAAGFRDARAGQRITVDPSGIVRLP